MEETKIKIFVLLSPSQATSGCVWLTLDWGLCSNQSKPKELWKVIKCFKCQLSLTFCIILHPFALCSFRCGYGTRERNVPEPQGAASKGGNKLYTKETINEILKWQQLHFHEDLLWPFTGSWLHSAIIQPWIKHATSKTIQTRCNRQTAVEHDQTRLKFVTKRVGATGWLVGQSLSWGAAGIWVSNATASFCHLLWLDCHLIHLILRWGSCSASCGNGSRTREISCSSGKHVFTILCRGTRCWFCCYSAVSKDVNKKCEKWTKMSIRCSESTTKSQSIDKAWRATVTHRPSQQRSRTATRLRTRNTLLQCLSR